jgi:hypothetical protein
VLDTSGYVLTTTQFPPPGDGALKLRWSDLDRATQRVVAAKLQAEGRAFRDLAGEELAKIITRVREGQ